MHCAALHRPATFSCTKHSQIRLKLPPGSPQNLWFRPLSFRLEKPSPSIAAKMPFPVSIGDAIVMAELALKIGQAFTKGRKSAPAEFREVESQLYSLSAALYALRAARESGISPPLLVDSSNLPRYIPSHHNDNQDIILGMLGSCKDTLSHLESIVKKYSIIGTLADPEQPRLKRWSRELKANWKKIAWTTEGGDLTALKNNLTIQTNSLNLILGVVVK